MKYYHEMIQLGMNVVFFFSFLHICTTFNHAGWIAFLPMQDYFSYITSRIGKLFNENGQMLFFPKYTVDAVWNQESF